MYYIRMHACTRVQYNKITELQNYTIVYTNMAAITKFIAKNNKIIKQIHQPVKNVTFW